jgi:manganese/zinc/iron transport system permease protein
MTWLPLDTWIVITGVLAAASCGLLGCFIVLRRMSMMGDAISHAVLPGLAGAFLLTVWVQGALAPAIVEDGIGPEAARALPGWLDVLVQMDARSGPIMFIGAAFVGVLTAAFTQLVHRFGRVEENASMGVVFTTLFAVGLIMMVQAADKVDLDPGCVLYGAIELVPLDEVAVFGLAVPRAAATLAIVMVVDVLFVIAFYKELKITSFDPTLATTLGIKANLMHYLLMTLVAITTVAAFEAVGSILVVAMLIVPAAAAHLLTERLPSMLITSVIIAAAGAAGGHLAAITVPTWFGYPDTSTAGSMAVVTGLLFTVALLFAPRHGTVSRLIRRIELGRRIVREDILGLLYRLDEHAIREPASECAERIHGALPVSRITSRIALASLVRRGLVIRGDDRLEMTPAGREVASGLVRSHRLWESYLVKHLALPADHVHATAMRLEHVTGEAMREHLAAHADHPETDPHGQSIPPPPSPHERPEDGEAD